MLPMHKYILSRGFHSRLDQLISASLYLLARELSSHVLSDADRLVKLHRTEADGLEN
jgi:hypothetical protein